MAARHQRGQRDQRPASAVEARPRPDGAPGIFGDQPLEVGGEIGGRRDGPVDVRVTEDLAPNRHPAGIHVVGGRRRRRCRSCACSAISAATGPGASAGARCADAVQHDQPPVLDTGGDALQVIRRSGDVLAACDGQDRCADLLQPVGDVESRQRLTHLRIGAGVRVTQRIEKRRADTRLALGKSAGNQRCAAAGEHGFGSRRADGRGALPPRRPGCRSPHRCTAGSPTPPGTAHPAAVADPTQPPTESPA